METNPTAAVLIIGNEIISGRTQDVNLGWLGAELSKIGIGLKEGRVVPDIAQEIISSVNALRARYDYVFTTGGIGPTHDDITTASIARAFNVPVIRHEDAESMLLTHYHGGEVNAARMKMADVPEGAVLISNPVSAAPGYRIENVFVFAGVPRIMQAMFENIRHELQTGEPVLSRAVMTHLTEGTIAQGLMEIQNASPQIDIGSYPMIKSGKLGSSLVLRGTDAALLDSTMQRVRALITALGGEVIAEE